MANEHVNKVIINNQTVIDLTADSITRADLAYGATAHDASGAPIVGTHVDPTFSTQTKTATPTESSQDITPDSGYDGLSRVTVNAISSTYVGSGVTRQASKTVTPTKSTQTAVASGVYTTGAVTVGAIPAQYIVTTDATASAGDIVQSKTAYVNGSKVTGSLAIQKYYMGSSTPASSLGNNGDLYLKTND